MTRRREDEVVGRSLRTRSTHGAVRGPLNGRGWGLRRDEPQRIEVQCRVSVSGRYVNLLHYPFSSPCQKLHAVRLEAMLLRLHVAVGPSKVLRADAIALPAELGGAAGPYLPLVHDNAVR